MGLPFLNPRKVGSVIAAARKPDGSLEPKGEVGEPDHALMSAAEDLIRAVHMKDANAVVNALQAAFEMMDSSQDMEMGE